ncbi:MAG: hypothetical protein IT168_13605 [Bryobacterales bacterium]|nr:hypothetical protein [Bryobacterales bacterium]
MVRYALIFALLAAAALPAADIRIQATVPTAPPAWALLERQVIEQSSAAAIEFSQKYQAPDGSLIWRTTGTARFDDLPESFYNWPVLYALGGDDQLKDLSFRAWNGTLRQLGRFGSLNREFPRTLDWFHIAEGVLLYYSLALADPTDAANIDRARRYAAFYIGADATAPNYDPRLKMLRSPLTGSEGPSLPTPGKAPPWRYSLGMSSYGLPLDDIPGITRFEDLKDERNALRMGQSIQSRMMVGDVAANLGSTALVAHAAILTGDDRYGAWVREYVNAWIARAGANGNIAPDNVGPSGNVGELHNGHWWGGHYGWHWPHGYYNIGMALQGAAENAQLVSRGDTSYYDLPRNTMDHILAAGKDYHGAFLVPFKRGARGWFAYQPMDLHFMARLWSATLAQQDWNRIEDLRRRMKVDWNTATEMPFPSDGKALRPELMNDCWFCDIYGKADWRESVETHTKEDRGHEAPWLRFVAGDNPTYPEIILRQTLSQMAMRLRWIRDNRIVRVYDPRIEPPNTPPDIRNANAHHWHTVNPVSTEALLQLTGGAAQQIYNAGLVQSHLRYFDPTRRRPGLPTDVAALVQRISDGKIEFDLVNVSAFHARDVTVQAGLYGQDQFQTISYDEREDRDPEQPRHSLIPQPRSKQAQRSVGSRAFTVHLPPSTSIHISAQVKRFAYPPTYRFPWAVN